MEHDFWLDKWRRDEIGFHEVATHPLLIRHWDSIVDGASGGVFVPLCGKSNDLLWLRERGHRVIGVELSDIAVRGFFVDNGIDYQEVTVGKMRRFSGDGIVLWCGDFFDLPAETLEGVTCFYDRAALIALPPDIRVSYVERLCELLGTGAAGLLITISYPSELFSPPPFSIAPDEVSERFTTGFSVVPLGATPGRAKGHDCREHAFVLERTI